MQSKKIFNLFLILIFLFSATFVFASGDELAVTYFGKMELDSQINNTGIIGNTYDLHIIVENRFLETFYYDEETLNLTTNFPGDNISIPFFIDDRCGGNCSIPSSNSITFTYEWTPSEIAGTRTFTMSIGSETVNFEAVNNEINVNSVLDELMEIYDNISILIFDNQAWINISGVDFNDTVFKLVDIEYNVNATWHGAEWSSIWNGFEFEALIEEGSKNITLTNFSTNYHIIQTFFEQYCKENNDELGYTIEECNNCFNNLEKVNKIVEHSRNNSNFNNNGWTFDGTISKYDDVIEFYVLYGDNSTELINKLEHLMTEVMPTTPSPLLAMFDDFEFSNLNFDIQNSSKAQTTYDIQNLSSNPGTYITYFNYEDQYNNTGTIEMLVTVLVVEKPVVTLITPENNIYTNNENITLTYTVEGLNVESCNLYLNDVLTKTSNEISTTNTFELEELTDNVYNWKVKCNNSESLEGESETRVFNLDTVNPELTVNELNATETNQLTFTFTGTFSEIINTFRINSQNRLASITGLTFSSTEQLIQEGINQFLFTFVDKAGNTDSLVRTIILDSIPPVLIVNELPELTNQNSVEVSGITDGINLTVNNVLKSIVNETFNFTQSLNEGSNTLTFTAADTAGNTRTITRNVRKDTIPPVVEIDPISSPTNNPSVMITGKVSGTTLTTALLNHNGENESITLTNGIFSKEKTLTEGLNTFSVFVSDQAENMGGDSINITLDTTNPNLTLIHNDGNTIQLNISSDKVLSSISASIKNPAGTTITVSLTPTSATTYTGSFTASRNGQHIISVTGTDSLGNKATETSTFNAEIVKLNLVQTDISTFKITTNINSNMGVVVKDSTDTIVGGDSSSDTSLLDFTFNAPATDEYTIIANATSPNTGSYDEKNAKFNVVIQNFVNNTKIQINSTTKNSSIELTTNSTTNGTVVINEYNESQTRENIYGRKLLSKFVDFNVDENLTNSIKNITIRMCYTDAELNAMGLNEGNIQLFIYNETSSFWEPLDSIINKGIKCVERVQNHLSTYSIGGNYTYDVNISADPSKTNDDVLINMTVNETQQKSFEVLVKKDSTTIANLTDNMVHSAVNEWTYTYTVPETEGTYVVEVKSIDNYNTEDTDSTTFEVDKTKPSITLDVPKFTSQNPLTIEGTITDSNSITSRVLKLNGTTTILGSNTFSETKTLDEGINMIVIEATDEAGNKQVTSKNTILDTTPPVINTPIQTNIVERTETQTISVEVIDDNSLEKVWIELDGSNTTLSGSNNVYTYSVDTGEVGIFDYTIWANDTAGNMNNLTKSYSVVDTISPEITISSPSNNSVTRNNYVTLTISTNEQTLTNYSLDSETEVLFFNGTNNTTTLTGLSEGIHDVLVTSIDPSGNTASKEINFRIDLRSDCTDGEQITSACYCGGTVYSSGYCCDGTHRTSACPSSVSSSGGSLPVTPQVEEVEDIIVYEEQKSVDIIVPYTEVFFDEEKLSVGRIFLESTEDIQNIQVHVKTLRRSPVQEVNTRVYKYLELTLSEQAAITNAEVDFTVEKSWFEENNLSYQDIALFRFTNSWEELPTQLIEETEDSYKFKASTPGFSYFAIAEKEFKTEVEETAEKEKQDLITGKVVDDKDFELGKFGKTIIYIILGIIAFMLVLKFMNVKPPKPEKVASKHIFRSRKHANKAMHYHKKAGIYHNKRMYDEANKHMHLAKKHSALSVREREKAKKVYRRASMKRAMYLHKKAQAFYDIGKFDLAKKHYGLARKYREKADKLKE